VLKSHEVLRNAIDKVGAKSLADDLKLSAALIYKWCEEPSNQNSDITASGAVNPLDRISEIYEKTKDVELINWICRMANGYFVQNMLIDEMRPAAQLFKNTQSLIQGFSETLEKISECCDDNRITHKEAENIRKEWEDLKRIGEGFVYACELGKFNKPRKEKERS